MIKKIYRLDGNRITSKGAIMLFDTLRTTNSAITHVSLHANYRVNDQCIFSLGDYIKVNKSIETVNISFTQISDVGIELLVPYLDGNTILKNLNLSGIKKLTDDSIPMLMKMIESSHIEVLEISFSSITRSYIFIAPLACNMIKSKSYQLYLRLM